MDKASQQTAVAATRSTEPATAGRQQGIDALRFLLCFAVAWLHAMPRGDLAAPPLWVVIAGSTCRGAVPFFFIASGYFAKIPDRIDWNFISRPILRLFPVYVLWMVIYFITESYSQGSLIHLGIRNLTGGLAIHLWFLPALGFAMIAVPILLLKMGRTATWLVCLVLAVMNLACVGYRDVLHLPEIGGTRMMIGPLLFLFGIELAQRTFTVKLWVATVGVVGAWAMTLAEEVIISHWSGTPLISHSSVATTYIFGLAIFLFAKSLPKLRIVTILAGFGYVSLGIYASHLLFVRVLPFVIGGETFLDSIITAILAIVISTVLCLFLARFNLTRRFVR